MAGTGTAAVGRFGALRPSALDRLHGREAELWEIETTAPSASTVRVAIGERGIGKSRLLDEVAARARVRTVVVRGARDLSAFAASHADDPRGPRTLALMDDLDRLPDDEWMQVLYLGRRLPAPLGVLATAGAAFLPIATGGGVDVSVVEPLTTQASEALVRQRRGDALAEPVRSRLIETARGNPRALIDLTEALGSGVGEGRRGVPDPLALHRTAVEYWLRDVPLASGSARALVALLDTPQRSLLRTAADGLGVQIPWEAWEDCGLISREAASVMFRAPVMRSALLASTATANRSQAAQALADVLPAQDADLSIWLRATAVPTPDAELRDALIASEPAARRRGGPGRSVEVLTRAAQLCEQPADASSVLVAAAHAAWQAGWRVRAAELLHEAEPVFDDARPIADLVTGALALGGGNPRTAVEQMLRGAREGGSHDPDLALDMLARVVGAAMWEGRDDLLERAIAALPSKDPASPHGILVAHTARAALGVLRDDFSELPRLRRALHAAGPSLSSPRQLVFAAEIGGLLGDDETAVRFLEQASRLSQGSASRAEAAFALELYAHVNVWQGRLEAAAAAARAGLDLARSLGESREGPFPLGMLAHVAALRGDHGDCAALAARAKAAAGNVEPATVIWARGRAALSRGDFEKATEILAAVARATAGNTLVALYATPDIVEAAAETGRWEDADRSLVRFEQWAAHGSPWAAALLARLHALRAPHDDAAAALAESLAHGASGAGTFDDARTRLVLGRTLRRLRRRSEAREYLRVAAVDFESLGAAGWAARAQAELRAAGESVAASDQGWGTLSEQERAIAEMIGEGLSNREAAEKMHLSPRTIEYHLSKVYVKLGVASRTQLSRLIAQHSTNHLGSPAPSAPAG